MELYTFEQVAKKLGVPYRTALKLKETGLKVVQLSPRVQRVRAQDLEEYVEQKVRIFAGTLSPLGPNPVKSDNSPNGVK